MSRMSTLDTQGPFLVGALVSSSLGGVAACLGVIYFHRWPYGKDRMFIFWTVSFLSVLNLASIASSFWALWDVTVTDPGMISLHGLARVPTGFLVNVVLYAICAYVVQTFYAYRIWLASDHQRRLAGAVMTLATLSFACGGTSSIGALVLSHPEAVNPPGSSQLRFSLAYAGLGLAALTDALITLSTYHYIRRANRAFPRASRLPALERLLRTTAETNALTFVVVLANVAVLAASVGFWLAAINEMVPVVYTISLLVSVLSRTHGREGGAGEGVRGSEEERAVAARHRVRDAAWVPNSLAERRDSLFTLVGLASKGSKTEEATADQPTTPASPLAHIPLINPGAPHAVSIALSA